MKLVLKQLLPVFILFPFISSCSNGPPVAENRDDGTVLFQQAKVFDAFLHDELSPEEKNSLISSCKSQPKANPFCFSVHRTKYVLRYKRKMEKIASPTMKKKVIPVRVRFSKKGNPINFWGLRKADVKSLLKGLSDLSMEQLEKIASLAAREKRCPNRVAIATAATLEDHLPDPRLLPVIAKLYERGGWCSPRRSSDREQFLTRAGLFYYMHGDFNESARLFARVAPTDAFSGRSLYWLYQSHQESANFKESEKALERLLTRHPFSFHAMVASLKTNRDLAERYFSNTQSLPKRSKQSPAANQIIEQAEVLKHYGFDRSSALLVNWILGSYGRIEAAVKVYLTALGNAHTKVTTLPVLLIKHPDLISKEVLSLSYPIPHLWHFEKYRSGVDLYLLLSLARKESEFNPNAVSHANAQGLLQIHPKTGDKLTIGTPDLLDLKTNITVGAKYFSQLLDRYNDQSHVALAAYNAGEKSASRWVKRYPTSDPVLFIDLISYRETRDYVGFVLSNYYWYRRLYKDATQGAVRKHLALDKH